MLSSGEKNKICNTALPFFDNIFTVNDSDLFSNSLCKLFILKILNKRNHRLEELIEALKLLGHPEVLIEEALEHLLACNIIWSQEGIELYGHHLINLTSSNTTLCKQYLETIHCTLFYLQGFAYCTPLEDDLRDEIPLPHNIEDDDRNFYERVRAASILFRQIERDVFKQKAYIQSLPDNERNRAERIYYDFEFDKALANIRNGIMRDLNNIQRSWRNSECNWDLLKSYFNVYKPED